MTVVVQKTKSTHVVTGSHPSRFLQVILAGGGSPGVADCRKGQKHQIIPADRSSVQKNCRGLPVFVIGDETEAAKAVCGSKSIFLRTGTVKAVLKKHKRAIHPGRLFITERKKCDSVWRGMAPIVLYGHELTIKPDFRFFSSIALLPGSCYNIKNGKLYENGRTSERKYDQKNKMS